VCAQCLYEAPFAGIVDANAPMTLTRAPVQANAAAMALDDGDNARKHAVQLAQSGLHCRQCGVLFGCACVCWRLCARVTRVRAHSRSYMILAIKSVRQCRAQVISHSRSLSLSLSVAASSPAHLLPVPDALHESGVSARQQRAYATGDTCAYGDVDTDIATVVVSSRCEVSVRAHARRIFNTA
jgi:hypothetical protein